MGISVAEPEERSMLKLTVSENNSQAGARCGEEIQDFEGRIGICPALLNVLDLVRTVVPTDSTLLKRGDSTGMELVNCAAIPLHLFESKRLGHEKAAFAGALTRNIGRLGARGGTLFLDKIGFLPTGHKASKVIQRMVVGAGQKIDIALYDWPAIREKSRATI
jgi:transcriptional regulator with GAF, ATPase, and Fis domain